MWSSSLLGAGGARWCCGFAAAWWVLAGLCAGLLVLLLLLLLATQTRVYTVGDEAPQLHEQQPSMHAAPPPVQPPPPPPPPSTHSLPHSTPSPPSPSPSPPPSSTRVLLRAPAQLTADDFLLPSFNLSFLAPLSFPSFSPSSSSPPPVLTLYTAFSPTYAHVPSLLPMRSWTLLPLTSILIFTPDELTCAYLTTTHKLSLPSDPSAQLLPNQSSTSDAIPSPVPTLTCMPLPTCFADRQRKRRRKPNRGSLVWEADVDAQREARVACMLKEAERVATTPLLGYFEHSALLTVDVLHALQAVLQARGVGRGMGEEGEARMRQQPFIIVGRSWQVDTRDAPSMRWTGGGSRGNSTHLAHARYTLGAYVATLRAQSLLRHRRYQSTFPTAEDALFAATHHARAIRWFLYPRGVLPLHLFARGMHASDDDDERDEGSAWETHVVYSTRSKSKPAAVIIDVSDAAHVMHSHRPSSHSHSSHPLPSSLVVIPEGANETERQRLLSPTLWAALNPSAAPVSAAGADLRLVQSGDAAPHAPLQLALVPNPSSLPTLLASVAVHGQVVLVVVSSSQVRLALSFICRAAEVGLASVLFVAEDQRSYWALRARRVAVWLVPYARVDKEAAAGVGGAGEEGDCSVEPPSWLLDESRMWLTAALHAAAQLQLATLLLPLTALLLDNPLPSLARPTAAFACDVVLPLNQTSSTAAQPTQPSYFPTTPLAVRLMSELRTCEEENALFAHQHSGSRFAYSDDRSASCLSTISRRLTRRAGMRTCGMSQLDYPSELDFFHHQKPQHMGVWPTLVTVDAQATVEGVERVMKEWSLWGWDEDGERQVEAALKAEKELWEGEREGEEEGEGDMEGEGFKKQGVDDERLWRVKAEREVEVRASFDSIYASPQLVHCVAVHRAADAMMELPTAPPSPFTLHVHVLAGQEAGEARLQATLQSLMAVEATPAAIHLRLHVDLAFLAAPAVVAGLEQLRWHGQRVSVRSLPAVDGANADWMRTWPEVSSRTSADGDRSILSLALTAGQLVSPQLLSFLSSLLSPSSSTSPSSSSSSSSSFFYSPASDPHLLSINLLHLPIVAGETPRHRYGSRTTRSVLPSSSLLFRYQLSALTGSVYFLPTLCAFLAWYDAHAPAPSRPSQREPPSTYPCVPSLHTNLDYLAAPHLHFEQWLHRYAFELGHNSLHTQLLGSHDTGRVTEDGCSATSECSVLVFVLDDPSTSPHSTRLRLVQSPYTPPLLSPTSPHLPLYDFHMHLLDPPSVPLLARRSSMFAPHNAVDHTPWSTDTPDLSFLAPDDQELYAEEEEEEDIAPVLNSSSPLSPAGVVALQQRKRVTRRLSDGERADATAFSVLLAHADARTRRAKVSGEANREGVLYPSSLQERCWVVGSAADVEWDAEDEELHVRPHIPPASHPAYSSLLAYHRHLSRLHHMRLVTVRDRVKVVLYSPVVASVPGGAAVHVQLGRALRGLYFAFLLALCTERWLLVDLPELHSLYAEPSTGISWRYEEHAEVLGKLPTLTLNQSHAGQLRSADLRGGQWGAVAVLRVQQLVSHDRALLQNPTTRWLQEALFHSTSRAERTAQVMQHLLAQPHPSLTQQAAALLEVLHLQSSPHHLTRTIAVRLDTPDATQPATAANPLPRVSRGYLACAMSVVSTYALHPNVTRILFTSNTPNKHTFHAIHALLSPYGTVLTYADSHHRLRQRMEATEEMGGGPVTLQAEQLIGHVLPMLDVQLFSDTTLGLFHTARGGWQSRWPGRWGEDGEGAVLEEGEGAGQEGEEDDADAMGRVASGGVAGVSELWGETSFVFVEGKASNEAGEEGQEEEGYCGPVRRKDRHKRMDVVF